MSNNNFSVIGVIRQWIRKLYDWTLRWADTPQCMAALFGFALIESSFFPIPPDVILIAIVASKPSRWLSAATLCTAGSVVGAALGYLIGLSFMATLGQPIIDWYDAQASWAYVVNVFAGPFGIGILAAAAFTPIPFKVFTIAAGATGMSFWPFLIVSAFGRAGRFFLVAAILRIFGAPVRKMLERHLELAALIFFLLLLGGFLVVKVF